MKTNSRIKRAWNAFFNKRDPTNENHMDEPEVYMSPLNRRQRYRYKSEKTVVSMIYNRIALDVASLSISHIKIDDEGHYIDKIKSKLNECLSLSPNIDQTPISFIQDIVLSLFDEGCVAVVPVDIEEENDTFDVLSLRVGRITSWFPTSINVELYNEATGMEETVRVSKKFAAIIENPFYIIMNETNSTFQRLIRTLQLLDAAGENSRGGKLDIIIQLPYSTRTEIRKKQAESRKKEIEMQLTTSKYGIAYTDASERVTQLNRPADNNLLSQAEYLTKLAFNQLGLCESIFDGTADEQVLVNYYNSSVYPVISAIVESMRRCFISKTARRNNETIAYFNNPFRLATVGKISEVADKMTRNEIMSSNEFRSIIGYKPSSDPRADELLNKNIAHPLEENKDKTSINNQ